MFEKPNRSSFTLYMYIVFFPQVFDVPREVAKAQWKQHRKAVATRVKQERHVAQNSTWTRRTHAAAPGAPLPPLPPPLPASATGANSIAVAMPGACKC